MLYRLILSIGLRSSLRQSPPYTASDPRWLAVVQITLHHLQLHSRCLFCSLESLSFSVVKPNLTHSQSTSWQGLTNSIGIRPRGDDTPLSDVYTFLTGNQLHRDLVHYWRRKPKQCYFPQWQLRFPFDHQSGFWPPFFEDPYLYRFRPWAADHLDYLRTAGSFIRHFFHRAGLHVAAI